MKVRPLNLIPWRILTPIVFLTMMFPLPATAGRNAGGALIVHTDDTVAYTVTGDYCLTSYLPASCEAAITRTDKDEDHPAVIWLLAAFPDTSSPAVTTIQFGIEHNLPANEGYFEAHGKCGELEMPDTGWPETGFGNLLSFGSTARTERLFPFYWFAAYGFEGAYLGTRTYPSTDEAKFVDEGQVPVEDAITRFGIVRWGDVGSNACPGANGPDGPDHADGGLLENGMPTGIVYHGLRWPLLAQISVLLGHDDVMNLSRGEVMAMEGRAVGAWMQHFPSGAVSFTMTEGDDAQYIDEYDGWSILTWRDQAGLPGRIAVTSAWPDIQHEAPNRIAEVDMVFNSSIIEPPRQCFADCLEPHGYCSSGNEWIFDVESVSKHEWGHGLVGLGHYQELDWNTSIMTDGWENPPNCIQHNLQQLDVDYAEWIYNNAFGDRGEPDNDYLVTPIDLGLLSYNGQSIDNGGQDALPGYSDTDCFSVQVTNSQNEKLQFVVYAGMNDSTPFTVDVRSPYGWEWTFACETLGGNVFGEVDAQSGVWLMRVRSADWVTSAPNTYLLEVRMAQPVCDVVDNGNTIAYEPTGLHVNAITRTAWGRNVREGAVLRLMDVGGREIWLRHLPGMGVWSEDVGPGLSSGVYFLRLEDGSSRVVQRFINVK